MRDDMSKVLTERTRKRNESGISANGFNAKNRANHKFVRYYHGHRDDFLPTRESMRKRHHVGLYMKEFSDLLNPLIRWLNKQVGRNWNDVWSEICKTLKGNGVLQIHLKNHIKNEVRGVPFSNYFFSSREEIGGPNPSFRGYTLYVNLDGVLCRYQPAAKSRKDKKG